MDRQGPNKKARQKRNRTITACSGCRDSKARCDRIRPACTRCKTREDDCIYLDPPHGALINGESRIVDSLPTSVKEGVSRLYKQSSGDAKDEDGSDLEGLEATPFATESASFEDDVDETPMSDFGFRIGKMHMTDRIGGQFRPLLVQELKMLLQTTIHQREWAEEQFKWPTATKLTDVGMLPPDQDFLEPSANYMVPNLNIFASTPSVDVVTYLPPRDVSLRILKSYWNSVHPVVRVVHRPSFERRWEVFATQISSGIRPVASLQALVFSVLFSGIAAMRAKSLDMEMQHDQDLWLDKLKTGTELSLSQAQVLQTTKVETLQAFVAYLLIVCRAEVSKIHSTFVASAIRIAEFNGLHIDGSERSYSPVATHVRRLLWHNLCILDLRTAEAQGPWPIIDPSNFTTKFPSNLDDCDIPNPAKMRSDTRWTENTLSLIRFRCAAFVRSLWTIRRKLVKKEATITSAITFIESFRAEWSVKLAPSNAEDPAQRYGLCIFDLITSRAYAAILQNYHVHSGLKMPDRLLSILIQHGIKNMDRVIELETTPEYEQFNWYSGAIQQHHFAFLMAVEMIMHPRRKDSARIWRGLNYVFEPPDLPPIARARWIVTQAWGRMQVYLSKRSLKVPRNLEEKMQEALRLSEAGLQLTGRELSIASERSGSVASVSPFPDRQGSYFDSAQSTNSPSSNPHEEHGLGHKSNDGHDDWRVPPPSAPEKQLLNVDWNVLDTYYPATEFSSDLDMDFDAWAEMLDGGYASTNFSSSSNFPATTIMGSIGDKFTSDPTMTLSSQGWLPSDSRAATAVQQSLSSSPYSLNRKIQDDGVRQYNSESNFGMGFYYMPSRN